MKDWRVVSNVENRPERWVRVMETLGLWTERLISIEVVSKPSPYMEQVTITVAELHAIALAVGLAPAPLPDPDPAQGARQSYQPPHIFNSKHPHSVCQTCGLFREAPCHVQ